MGRPLKFTNRTEPGWCVLLIDQNLMGSDPESRNGKKRKFRAFLTNARVG